MGRRRCAGPQRRARHRVRVVEREHPDSHGRRREAAGRTVELHGRPRFMARTFVVFNAAQVDGHTPALIVRDTVEQIDTAEQFLATIGAHVEHRNEGRAYYSPAHDLIVLPPRNTFTDTAAYYATSAHDPFTGPAMRSVSPVISPADTARTPTPSKNSSPNSPPRSPARSSASPPPHGRTTPSTWPTGSTCSVPTRKHSTRSPGKPKPQPTCSPVSPATTTPRTTTTTNRTTSSGYWPWPWREGAARCRVSNPGLLRRRPTPCRDQDS